MFERWWRGGIAVAAVALEACGGDPSPPQPPPPPLVLDQVSTLVGTRDGPGLVDAAGAAARFREPRGVIRAGPALYLVDAGNEAVRRVDLSTWQVTTLAGGGSPGQVPADGSASAARFSKLTGAIASDGTSLYLGDSGAIRRVDLATGAVDTFAGRVAEPGYTDGSGDAARFLDPGGLAIGGGMLWIADTGNQAIRALTLATRQVSTLAGAPGPCGAADGTGTAARFCRPTGIAAAGSRILVADSGNHAIREVAAGTGTVTTLAGVPGQAGLTDGSGAAARFQDPAGLATDGATLYVAQRRTLRAVSLATGGVSTLAGSGWVSGSQDGAGAAAQFGDAVGVAADGGTLYLADAGNHSIRALDVATRTATTLAGSPPGSLRYGAPLFDSPSGIAAGTAPGGGYYVADTGNHVIRKLAQDGVTYEWRVTTIAGTPRMPGAQDGAGPSVRFASPEGIAVDAGAVYVADTGNHTIRRIDLATAEVSTMAGSAGDAGSADGVGVTARFCSPGALTVGTGALYVADTGNHTLRRLDLGTGEVTTVAGSAGEPGAQDGVGAAARFDAPEALVAVGDLLFVADTWNATIRRVDPATREVTTLAGSPGQHGDVDGIGPAARFDLPTAISATTYAGSTTLFVADAGNVGDVRYVDVDTATVGPVWSGSYGWRIPTHYEHRSVALRPRGLVGVWGWFLVADSGGHTVRALESGIWRSTLAGTEMTPGHADGSDYTIPFGSPAGIACDGDSLYVADRNNTWVRRVSASSGDSTVVASIVQGLQGPAGVAVAGGRLYVADALNGQILLVPAPLQDAVVLAGGFWSGYQDGPGETAAFSSPWGMASDGTFLYVADTDNSAIRRVSLASGLVGTVAGGPGSPDIFLPVGVATDGTTIWVSDGGRAVIRSVSLATGAVATLAGALDRPGAADGRGEAARFDAPLGVALHGRTLYVADSGNRAIRAVDVDTGDVTTVAGSALADGMRDGTVAEAVFAAPVAVCVTGSGLAVLDSPGYGRWPAPPPLYSDAAVRLIH